MILIIRFTSFPSESKWEFYRSHTFEKISKNHSTKSHKIFPHTSLHTPLTDVAKLSLDRFSITQKLLLSTKCYSLDKRYLWCKQSGWRELMCNWQQIFEKRLCEFVMNIEKAHTLSYTFLDCSNSFFYFQASAPPSFHLTFFYMTHHPFLSTLLSSIPALYIVLHKFQQYLPLFIDVFWVPVCVIINSIYDVWVYPCCFLADKWNSSSQQD